MSIWFPLGLEMIPFNYTTPERDFLWQIFLKKILSGLLSQNGAPGRYNSIRKIAPEMGQITAKVIPDSAQRLQSPVRDGI